MNTIGPRDQFKPIRTITCLDGEPRLRAGKKKGRQFSVPKQVSLLAGYIVIQAIL